MAYVPVSRVIAKRFGGEVNLRMAVSKAVSTINLSFSLLRLLQKYFSCCFHMSSFSGVNLFPV